MSQNFLLFAGQDLLLPEAAVPDPALDPELGAGLRGSARSDFSWRGRAYTALALEGAELEAALGRGLLRLPLRQCLASWSEEGLRPALKGLGLLNWRSGSRFCGSCGGPLTAPGEPRPPAADGDEEEHLSLSCPACGREHFPRISPAVIVLVKKGGRALLARNARMPPGGRFGLLAGFVEVGESLEEAALREVREEAGIEIGGLRYVSSQPWPFPDSLMVAFVADWLSGESRPDGREIAELRWCGPEELPEIPPRGSVARALIDDFVREARAD